MGLVWVAGVCAYLQLWRHVGISSWYFGGDLVAYSSAAQRLAASGSPYDHALLVGEVQSGAAAWYLYPPVLAQLFLPLRDIPTFALAVGWSSAQAICLMVVLPLAYAIDRL